VEESMQSISIQQRFHTQQKKQIKNGSKEMHTFHKENSQTFKLGKCQFFLILPFSFFFVNIFLFFYLYNYTTAGVSPTVQFQNKCQEVTAASFRLNAAELQKLNKVNYFSPHVY
jgi:hypothetical protein